MNVSTACAAWLQAAAAGGVPVLVTFVDELPHGRQHPWPLGLTAAAHRVPLVVVGLRKAPAKKKSGGFDFMSKSQKWYGFERAVRLLEAAGARAIMFADGFDVLVANAPAAALGQLHPSRLLWGAECNSWPACFKSDCALSNLKGP